MSNETSRPVDILLIEDNDADADLVIEALNDAKVSVNIEIVNDGQKALDFFYHKNEYSNAFRPDLILLDLNLPKVDGREILSKIKADPKLKCIPVIVLTTSESDEDVANMYSNHANCYIKKPVDFDQFHAVIKETTDFWFTVVKLPPEKCGHIDKF